MHDKGWKASGYFNTSLMDGWGYDRSYGKRLTTTDYKQREKNTTYGFDVQKEWKLAKADAVFGMNYQREQFENLTDYLKYARNNWGIFGQWEQKLNARDTAIVSARETWRCLATAEPEWPAKYCEVFVPAKADSAPTAESFGYDDSSVHENYCIGMF